MKSNIITLTTDFGLIDPYVGIMKGVILSINGDTKIVDLTHQISPGSISEAASIFQEAYSFFSKGTIHVAVIDPGVGSSRRPILIQTEDYYFVGPDNGLFWPIIKSASKIKIIHLTESNYFLPEVSTTFHGRDIFAPVAAYLSTGINPLDMGTVINDPVSLESQAIEIMGDVIYGKVVRVDNFGNLITNIHKRELKCFLDRHELNIRVSGVNVSDIKRSYSDVEKDEFLALFGSSNYLEIAVNGGMVCESLELSRKELIGTKVEVCCATEKKLNL